MFGRQVEVGESPLPQRNFYVHGRGHDLGIFYGGRQVGKQFGHLLFGF